MKHTPEPWSSEKYFNGTLLIGDGRPGTSVASIRHGSITEHDLARIVASVNACSGIPTSSLETFDPDLLYELCAMHPRARAALSKGLHEESGS